MITVGSWPGQLKFFRVTLAASTELALVELGTGGARALGRRVYRSVNSRQFLDLLENTRPLMAFHALIHCPAIYLVFAVE